MRYSPAVLIRDVWPTTPTVAPEQLVSSTVTCRGVHPAVVESASGGRRDGLLRSVAPSSQDAV